MMKAGLAVLIGLCLGTGAAIAEEAPKKLTAADLSVQTHKWDGKKIEVQLRCFFADKDEYRCVGANARIDFNKISNADGKTHIEDKCDTIPKAAGGNCLVTVMFVYSGFRSERNDSGGRMTFVEAEDDSGEIVPPGRKKR